MSSERKSGAGKSLDALVRAFRESPFAVFVPERSSVGVFEEHHIESAEIVLVNLSIFPNAVRDFFAYANRNISLCDYSDPDNKTNSLSRVQFHMAFSVELANGGTEYKYRLERESRDYLLLSTYRGMTARVLQMVPKLTQDFYAKLKHGDLPQFSIHTPVEIRKPRNPLYSRPDPSLVA